MRYSIFLLLMSLTFCTPGCKKDENVSIYPLAFINLVNASVNLGTVKVDFTGLKGVYSGISTSVAYGASFPYGLNAGMNVPITIVPTSDTTKIAFAGVFNLPQDETYTMYLAGTSTLVDTVFVKENHYPFYNDSSCAIRFVNLSYNSSPIIVTLSSTPTVSEFGTLIYKQSSAFKTYAALSTNGIYTFQVKDAATNNLLATYALVTPRFRGCTLALKGMVGGVGAYALGIMRINNY